jgi:hypothetical protein
VSALPPQNTSDHAIRIAVRHAIPELKEERHTLYSKDGLQNIDIEQAMQQIGRLTSGEDK